MGIQEDYNPTDIQKVGSAAYSILLQHLLRINGKVAALFIILLV